MYPMCHATTLGTPNYLFDEPLGHRPVPGRGHRAQERPPSHSRPNPCFSDRTRARALAALLFLAATLVVRKLFHKLQQDHPSEAARQDARRQKKTGTTRKKRIHLRTEKKKVEKMKKKELKGDKKAQPRNTAFNLGKRLCPAAVSHVGKKVLRRVEQPRLPNTPR